MQKSVSDVTFAIVASWGVFLSVWIGIIAYHFNAINNIDDPAAKITAAMGGDRKYARDFADVLASMQSALSSNEVTINTWSDVVAWQEAIRRPWMESTGHGTRGGIEDGWNDIVKSIVGDAEPVDSVVALDQLLEVVGKAKQAAERVGGGRDGRFFNAGSNL